VGRHHESLADQGVAPGPYRYAGARDPHPSPCGTATPAQTSARSHSDLPQIFQLVELGSIVCFFPASLTRRYPRPEIAYRPVADLEPATLAVAWPHDSHSATVAAFVRAATTVAAAAQPEATTSLHACTPTPRPSGTTEQPTPPPNAAMDRFPTRT